MQSRSCICNSNSMEVNFQEISTRNIFQVDLLQINLCQTSIIGMVCINKVITNRFCISIIKVIINKSFCSMTNNSQDKIRPNN